MRITGTHLVSHGTGRGITYERDQLLQCCRVVAERVGKAVHLVSEGLLQDVFATHDLIVRLALPEGVELGMRMRMTPALDPGLVYLDDLLPGEHRTHRLPSTAEPTTGFSHKGRWDIDRCGKTIAVQHW